MRKPKFNFYKIEVTAKVPARPLNDNERLAVAMGYIKCDFSEQKHVVWCGPRKHLTQSEFERAWKLADSKEKELTALVPGTLAFTETVGSDTPFLTGQIL